VVYNQKSSSSELYRENDEQMSQDEDKGLRTMPYAKNLRRWWVYSNG
jgi:hypothetical protein